MPHPTNSAKRRRKIVKIDHSLSVKCPQNARNPMTKGDIAEQARKLESALRKLLHISKNLSAHLKHTLRDSQIITDSHPAHQEFLAWERQFNDAIIQSEKTLKGF